MHSLHEINKQAKWEYNKDFLGSYFRIQMLVVSKTKLQMRLDDKRWNRVKLCF